MALTRVAYTPQMQHSLAYRTCFGVTVSGQKKKVDLPGGAAWMGMSGWLMVHSMVGAQAAVPML